MWLCNVTSNNARVTCCHVRIWWTRVCIPQSSETWILTLAATFLSPDGQEHTIAWWLYHTISSTVVPVGSDNIWSSTKWTVKRYIYCLLYLMQNFFRAVNICFIFITRIWLWLPYVLKTVSFWFERMSCCDTYLWWWPFIYICHLYLSNHSGLSRIFSWIFLLNQWCSNSVSRQ